MTTDFDFDDFDFLDLTSDGADEAIKQLAAINRSRLNPLEQRVTTPVLDLDEVTPKAAADTGNEHGAIKWPLSYRMPAPGKVNGNANSYGKQWWSHLLYRGPNDEPVKMLYSRTKAQSETIARLFLDEPVLGFDMEWPINYGKKQLPLQKQVSLIQVACEDKIALFHIGLHLGKNTEDLIAPSLRKIIESPDIAKTGVAVLNADMARLAKHFHLKPQGAFEVSHLHNLVTFGSWKPELVTTRLVKLATLVEKHLGLPLSKGPVRTSDWSKPLNQKQKDYAAADAYAGFMLYHSMNAKRAAMKPTPPLPLHADTYLPMAMPKILPVRLQPTKEGALFTSVEDFFGVIPPAPKSKTRGDGPVTVRTEDIAVTTITAETSSDQAGNDGARIATFKTRLATFKAKEPLDSISKSLYDKLCDRRKVLAAAASVPPYKIATNIVLEGLARDRPLDKPSMLRVKGIGKVMQEKYGAEWLEVIRDFSESDAVPVPTTPSRPARRIRREAPGSNQGSPDSSAAFGSPLQRTPQLNTGLSFSFAETNLDSHDRAKKDDEYSSSDDVFTTPRSRPTPPLKRKRAEDQTVGIKSFLTTEPPPQDPGSRIFRSKLDAYSKRMATMSKRKHIGPLVPSSTLDQIVQNPPRTIEELHRVPDITRLVEVCLELNKDLLGTITKFAAAARP